MIVIIHGLFGMLDNWMSIARRLSDHHQVLLIDVRNHGKSFHDEEMNYKLMAEDIVRLLSTLSTEKVHLVGHSMGGKIAMQVAHDHADILKSTTVIDIAPRQYPKVHDHIFDAIQSIDLSSINSRKEADQRLSEFISHLDVRQFLLKNLNRIEYGYAWKANFKAIQNNYEHIASPPLFTHLVDIPILFIKGSMSAYISPQDEKVITSWFSRCSLVEVAAGHWVHAEKPHDVLELLTSFVEQNDRFIPL